MISLTCLPTLSLRHQHNLMLGSVMYPLSDAHIKKIICCSLHLPLVTKCYSWTAYNEENKQTKTLAQAQFFLTYAQVNTVTLVQLFSYCICYWKKKRGQFKGNVFASLFRFLASPDLDKKVKRCIGVFPQCGLTKRDLQVFFFFTMHSLTS